jgi:hypothetical protein
LADLLIYRSPTVRVTLALRPILIKWPSAESVKGARATGIKFYTRAGIPGRAARVGILVTLLAISYLRT